MYDPVRTLSAIVWRNTSTPRVSAILVVVSTRSLGGLLFPRGNVHFFRLTLQIRMNEGYMVVTTNDVSERRQTLFYTLDFDCIWEGVSQML